MEGGGRHLFIIAARIRVIYFCRPWNTWMVRVSRRGAGVPENLTINFMWPNFTLYNKSDSMNSWSYVQIFRCWTNIHNMLNSVSNNWKFCFKVLPSINARCVVLSFSKAIDHLDGGERNKCVFYMTKAIIKTSSLELFLKRVINIYLSW